VYFSLKKTVFFKDLPKREDFSQKLNSVEGSRKSFILEITNLSLSSGKRPFFPVTSGWCQFGISAIAVSILGLTNIVISDRYIEEIKGYQSLLHGKLHGSD